MFHHAIGFFLHPKKQWETIANESDEKIKRYLPYAIVMALLPAVAWYIGTTQTGWEIGGRSFRLTEQSALPLTGLFYVAMLVSIAVIGYFIHWMADTYGAKNQSHPFKGVVIASFCATPLFVGGLAGIYPVWWFDLTLGVVAVCYAVYLLYLGIPIVMGIPQDRGFMFASAVVAVCLVVAVGIIASTAILWELVQMPVFTD